MKLPLIIIFLSCGASVLTLYEDVTVDPKLLTWLTVTVTAMGGFVAWLFKRLLDDQKEDRRALTESVAINRDFMEKIKDRDERIDDLVLEMQNQHREILRLLTELRKP